MASIIPYGPDNTMATKLVATVMEGPRDRHVASRPWTTDVEIRNDPVVAAELAEFLRAHRVKETVSSDRMLGCPHQEGIDYPMGRTCPQCPFWAHLDRFTHEPIVPPVATMTAPEVIEVLSADDLAQLDDALESADALREALVEPLIAAIDRGIANPTSESEADTNLFSYALYLLAKWRETRAYPVVVRWLSLPGEGPFDIGGDIVTQDGGRMLASVFDGDMAPIKALILDRNACEYGRAAGVTALTLLAAWAEVPRQPVIDCFSWLAREGLDREPGAIWDLLASYCVDLEAVELLPELRRAYDEKLVDPQFMGEDELLEVEMANGDLLESLKDRQPPIDDVLEATAWWDRGDRDLFDDDDDGDDEGLDEDGSIGVQEPYRAPPKVGRNEPCPCGSGKKYKKCCGG